MAPKTCSELYTAFSRFGAFKLIHYEGSEVQQTANIGPVKIWTSRADFLRKIAPERLQPLPNPT